MHYVRLTTIAALMGVTVGWLRGLIYQRVMDDERELIGKGSPHLMHAQQILQALVAKRMRGAGIGYDSIRLAIDKLEIDRAKHHKVRIAKGMDLTIQKSLYVLEARGFLKQANDLDYGVEEAA